VVYLSCCDSVENRLGGFGKFWAGRSVAGFAPEFARTRLPGCGSSGEPRNSATYSGAKAALTNMMEALRIDVRGRGFDVSPICPGFVRVRPPGGGYAHD
jgi:NAD(P)-dependent dehydrogenase (short-subunit alcohol dehydrogenase family)